jgi:hypothetical protein
LKKQNLQVGCAASDMLDEDDLQMLIGSDVWVADTPEKMNKKIWFVTECVQFEHVLKLLTL